MDKTQYGPDFEEHLLEQYKLYVELTDNVSKRRLRTNQFYISLLSGILTLLGLMIDRDVFNGQEGVLSVAFGALGLMLTWVWRVNIRSYRQLNTGRFVVIHEMEQLLPFPCFDREWEVLKRGQERKTYLQLSVVENLVPLLLGVPYLLLLGYGIYALIS